MEQGQNADDDWEANSSHGRNRKRSSILKSQKQKSICDLDTTDFTQQLTRRVSFASNNFVKPFVADPEKNTIWDNTYEEALFPSDSERTEVIRLNKTIIFEQQSSDMELTCAYTKLDYSELTRFNKTIIFDKQSNDMELTCGYTKLPIEEKENICLPELLHACNHDENLHTYPKSKFHQTHHGTLDTDLAFQRTENEAALVKTNSTEHTKNKLLKFQSSSNIFVDDIGNNADNISSLQDEEIMPNQTTGNKVVAVTVNHTECAKPLLLKLQSSHISFIDDNITNTKCIPNSSVQDRQMSLYSQVQNDTVAVTKSPTNHAKNNFLETQLPNTVFNNDIEHNLCSTTSFGQDREEIISCSPSSMKVLKSPLNKELEEQNATNPLNISMVANVNNTSHNFEAYEDLLFHQSSETCSDKLLMEEECSLVESLNSSDNVELEIINFVPQPVGNQVSRVIYSEAAVKPTTSISDITQDFEFLRSTHSTTVDTTQTLMAQIKLIENEPSSNISTNSVTAELESQLTGNMDKSNQKNPLLDILKDELVKFEFIPIDVARYEEEFRKTQNMCKEVNSRFKSIKFHTPEPMSKIINKLKYDSTLNSSTSEVPENNKKRLNYSMVRKKISEISSKTQLSFELKCFEKSFFNFSMLHKACYMIVRVDLKSYEVLMIKTYNCLKQNTGPITDFLKKLSKNNLHSFLGPHFDVISLLDYVYMAMEEILLL